MTHSFRSTWFGGLLIVIGLLAIAWWLETHDGMEPCPLCALQRLTLILLGALFLLGSLVRNTRRWLHFFISCLASVFAASGIWLAGRQVWLQLQPPDSTAGCGVSLQYLLKILPLHQALARAMEGSAECSSVTFTFMHLSLAQWSLGFFVFFLALSVLQLVRGFLRSAEG